MRLPRNVPIHNPIKVKTLSSILKSIAFHHEMSVEELLHELDLQSSVAICNPSSPPLL